MFRVINMSHKKSVFWGLLDINNKNVWKSDKSWEPGKIIKIKKKLNFENFRKGLLHLLSRCAANPYGHNSWWKWSKLNTTVIYHNMKLMSTDWSTIDPQMTWKTTYSHRMSCITISPYKQWDFSLYKFLGMIIKMTFTHWKMTWKTMCEGHLGNPNNIHTNFCFL